MPACEGEAVRAHQPLRRTAESQGPGDLLRLCHNAPAGGRSEEGQERVRPTQGFGGGTSEVGFGAEGGHRIPQGQGKPTGPGNQEGGERHVHPHQQRGKNAAGRKRAAFHFQSAAKRQFGQGPGAQSVADQETEAQ